MRPGIRFRNLALTAAVVAVVVVLASGCTKRAAKRAVDAPLVRLPHQAQPKPRPAKAKRVKPAKPKRQNGDPSSVPAAELKTALTEVLPERLNTQDDLDVARELSVNTAATGNALRRLIALEVGLRAWSIPLREGFTKCWLEVEEVGQHTTDSRLPGPPVVNYTLAQGSDHIYFIFCPGAAQNNPSARSQRLLKKLHPGEKIHQLFSLTGATKQRESAAAPTTPRWWSSWNDVSFQEWKPSVVASSDASTLWAIEAVEKNLPPNQQSRRVRLQLKASK